MSENIDARLVELGLDLPVAAAPAAHYVPAVLSGKLLYISGQISRSPSGEEINGKLGADLDIAMGQRAAEICALNILAQAKATLGTLDCVKRIVRLTGFVNSSPDFYDHPKVINGASDLLVKIFGERGKHSRCALGVAALPFNVAVEIDAIIEID